ncbi:MAG: carboxypeptidase regulatory-like domain-containing protein [Betaproteobacteria bacterium]|nr:carboxypeptidase regulatory-like domain-containing protein [Betaproteobacteria bacterium]
MKKTLASAILVLLVTGAWGQNLEMRDADGLRWVCGGVGADERRALAATNAQANLALVFVTVKRGGYVADVELSLFDASAKSARFTTATDGPMCLLRLPPGKYRLEASFAGVRRASAVAVTADAKQPVRVVFAFPGEPWDGIWASDEEKAQAREP